MLFWVMGISAANRHLGIMGGSFNPVHYGHLRVASDVKRTLALHSMRMMPAAQSPLKAEHSVSVEHRLAMLDLALTEFPELELDTRELDREGPSYTIDSLQALRQEAGDDATIYFVIGDDLLSTLNRWSRWQALTDYAHLIVASRPGTFMDIPSEVTAWWHDREIALADLSSTPSGRVSRLECSLVDVSSSEIRQLLNAGDRETGMIPHPVMEYIKRHKLYENSSQAEAVL
jgi:nicotinate-nucleotide adenylyltransferase